MAKQPVTGEVYVTGKITFARISSLREGKELEKYLKDYQGNFPITNPHTFIDLKDVEIVPADPNGNLSPAERLVQQRFYNSKKHGDIRFNISKQQYQPGQVAIPTVFQVQADSSVAQINASEPLPGEPSTDTPVTILVRVGYSSQWKKNMFILESVILPQNVEFRQFGGGAAKPSASVLSRMGLTLDESTIGQPISGDAPVIEENTQDESVISDEGFAMPPAQLNAATNAYAQSAPAQAPVATAPAQAAAPTVAQQAAAPAAQQAAPVAQQAPAQVVPQATAPAASGQTQTQAPQAAPAQVAPQAAAPLAQQTPAATPTAPAQAAAPAQATPAAPAAESASPFDVGPVAPDPNDPWANTGISPNGDYSA